MSEVALVHEVTSFVEGLSWLVSRGNTESVDKDGWIDWENAMLDFVALPHRNPSERIGLPRWWDSSDTPGLTWLVLWSERLVESEQDAREAEDYVWEIATLKQWHGLNATMVRLTIAQELSPESLVGLYRKGGELASAAVGWKEAARCWCAELSSEDLAGPDGERLRTIVRSFAPQVL